MADRRYALINQCYTKETADERFANVDVDETISGNWTFDGSLGLTAGFTTTRAVPNTPGQEVSYWGLTDSTSSSSWSIRLKNISGTDTEFRFSDRLGNAQVEIARAGLSPATNGLKVRLTDGTLAHVEAHRRILNNTSFTADYSTANGEYTYSTAQTITLPNGGTMPIGSHFYVHVISSVTLTIAQGSGATLQWTTGATTSTGNRSIGNGGWARIFKRASGTYMIHGQGIT